MQVSSESTLVGYFSQSTNDCPQKEVQMLMEIDHQNINKLLGFVKCVDRFCIYLESCGEIPLLHILLRR